MKGIPRCPHCGAIRKAVKAGKRRTRQGERQMWRCKKCGRKFTPGKYTRMRVPPEVIRAAVRLRRSGESYRRIAAIVLLRYNIVVSDVAVMKWMRKYGKVGTY